MCHNKLSMYLIFFVLLVTFVIDTNAWVPPSSYPVLPASLVTTGRRSRMSQPLMSPNEKISSSPTNDIRTDTTTRLLLWPVQKQEREPSIALTEEQDAALRLAAVALDKEYGPSWMDTSEAWDQARESYAILADYSDEELRTAFIRQSPKLLDVILYTPLGPFVLINLIAYFTGFSWCNTPFHAEKACL